MNLCLRARAVATKRVPCARTGPPVGLSSDRHCSGASPGSRHQNASLCLTAQKCGTPTTTMPGSPQALIHFCNHINTYSQTKRYNFSERIVFLLKHPIPVLFLRRGPRLICQAFISLKGKAKESEPIYPRTFKNLL